MAELTQAVKDKSVKIRELKALSRSLADSLDNQEIKDNLDQLPENCPLALALYNSIEEIKKIHSEISDLIYNGPFV